MISNKNRKQTLVGLDIEPTHIAACEVEANGTVAVRSAAVAALPPGVVRDGEVTDPAALAQALKELFREHGLPKRVRLGVANQRIVVRMLELPPVGDGKELRQAVTFLAGDELPMPVDQAVIDYHALGVVETPAGPRQRVLLVAARRDMVERLLGAVRAAGLNAAGIDLAAFAMVRALHQHAAHVQGTVAYANIAGMTNVALARGTECTFTRVVAGGYEALVAELAERRGLTLDHAREWLSHVGLASPLADVDGDAEIVAEARGVLADGARRIADEIRSTLDYVVMQENVEPAQACVLAGPAVAVPGFADELALSLGIPVISGVVAGDVPQGAESLSVAAGLAVEEVSA